jgi:hypothetical protein
VGAWGGASACHHAAAFSSSPSDGPPKRCKHHAVIVAGRQAAGFGASSCCFVALLPHAALEHRLFNCRNRSRYRRPNQRLVSGDLHTVPGSYGPDGPPEIVMDILLFEGMTAEQSLALGTNKVNGAPAAEGWEEGLPLSVSKMVPALRAVAGDHPPAVAG